MTSIHRHPSNAITWVENPLHRPSKLLRPEAKHLQPLPQSLRHRQSRQPVHLRLLNRYAGGLPVAFFIELRDQIFGDVLADVLGNLFRMAITSSRSFDLPILDIPKRIRAAQNLLHHHTGTLTDGHMPEAPEHVVVNEALTTPSNMHMQVIRVRGMTPLGLTRTESPLRPDANSAQSAPK